jgi:hypothetical protein
MTRLAFVLAAFSVALLFAPTEASAQDDSRRGSLGAALVLSVPNLISVVANAIVLDQGVRRSNFGPIFGLISGFITALCGVAMAEADLTAGLVVSIGGSASLALASAAASVERERPRPTGGLFLGP